MREKAGLCAVFPSAKGKGWCRVRTESKKKKGTFVVHVYHCENATWQGE